MLSTQAHSCALPSYPSHTLKDQGRKGETDHGCRLALVDVLEVAELVICAVADALEGKVALAALLPPAWNTAQQGKGSHETAKEQRQEARDLCHSFARTHETHTHIHTYTRNAHTHTHIHTKRTHTHTRAHTHKEFGCCSSRPPPQFVSPSARIALTGLLLAPALASRVGVCAPGVLVRVPAAVGHCAREPRKQYSDKSTKKGEEESGGERREKERANEDGHCGRR